MTRLGAKLPFREAAAEVWCSHRVAVGEATCRRVTYRHGQAAEAVVGEKVGRLEKEGIATTEAPARLMVSADGSYVHLTNGEWREVKGMAVGEFEEVGEAHDPDKEVKAHNLSYFTRSYQVRDFERLALAEVARRGVDQAGTVVAVNDGAQWIQQFLDYHCPQAVRVLDFAHALGYVAEAGRAIWGEESEAFKNWYSRCAHQLKHKPPTQTLAELKLLQPKAKGNEQLAALANAQRYLGNRLGMIDYPFFRRRGYPIGSGSVESAHKQVVQRRFRQAGMRWAARNVDPMLALRDLLSNQRWDEGWDEIVAFQWQQKRERMGQQARAKRPPPPAPITFAALKKAGLLPSASDSDSEPLPPAPAKPKRDPKDHPWRKGKWPTRPTWRYGKYHQQK